MQVNGQPTHEAKITALRIQCRGLQQENAGLARVIEAMRRDRANRDFIMFFVGMVWAVVIMLLMIALTWLPEG